MKPDPMLSTDEPFGIGWSNNIGGRTQSFRPSNPNREYELFGLSNQSVRKPDRRLLCRVSSDQQSKLEEAAMLDHKFDSTPFTDREQTAQDPTTIVPDSLQSSKSLPTVEEETVEDLTDKLPSGNSGVGQPPAAEPSPEAAAPKKRRRRPKMDLQESPPEVSAAAPTGALPATAVSASGNLPTGSVTTTASEDPDDDDPFSPKNLAISQNFAVMTPTKRLLTSVKVGKPDKADWVRTSPDPAYWVTGGVLELNGSGGKEYYWVIPALRDELDGEPCMKLVQLILAVTRRGTPLLWPIALPTSNKDPHRSTISQREAASNAKSQWVRIYWSGEENDNIVETAAFQAEPKWPTESMRDLLTIAFRDRIITDLDHPVVRQLRGLE